jgi:hypothetical protein
MKTCLGCAAEKPVSEFYLDRRGNPVARCKTCTCANIRLRYATDPEYKMRRKASGLKKRKRLTGAGLRAQRLPRQYGITSAEFDAMLVIQGGGCAICGTTEPGGRGQFHVDHDHKCCSGARSCGKCIRGLLCGTCNVGIGMLGDDVEKVARALEYLKHSALVQALSAAA